METKAIRKPNPSKPTRTQRQSDRPSDQEASDRPVTPNQNSERNSTMLTQTQPLNSTTVTLDNHPNGIGVLLAGNFIGNIEIDPVWGLSGTMHDTAMALGLVNRDECFTVQNQVFSTIEQATAQVIADHLASTATWTMPDYI